MESIREMQQNFKKSKNYLFKKAKEICAWEKEMLGISNEIINNLETSCLDRIDFSPENHEGEICFHIYNCANGEQKLYIKEFKFYSNNWKEKLLEDVSDN